MAWTPDINRIDTRGFKTNLIEFFRANQVDALKWANDGVALPPIKDFHLCPRLVTIFPALTFIAADHASAFGDILASTYNVTLEVAIIHGNRDTLALLGPKYAMAVESMLVNVPETTFNQGSIIPITSTPTTTDTVFAVQGKYKSQFIEVFQTKATWDIDASAYSD